MDDSTISYSHCDTPVGCSCHDTLNHNATDYSCRDAHRSHHDNDDLFRLENIRTMDDLSTFQIQTLEIDLRFKVVCALTILIIMIIFMVLFFPTKSRAQEGKYSQYLYHLYM